MTSRLNVDTLTSIVSEAMSDIVAIVDDEMTAKHRHASGRTQRETRAVVTVDGDTIHGQVLVPPYFDRIERGNPPGPQGGHFYAVIHRWAKDKGIISGDSISDRRISGAIAHHIIAYGTQAWQMGGEDVFTSEIDARLERLKEATQSAASREISNIIHLDVIS